MTAKLQESIEQVQVKPELQQHLRLYRRLWLSRSDLLQAMDIIHIIIEETKPFPQQNPPSAKLEALTSALVVTYARPFVNTRGESTVAEKTVPGSLLRGLTKLQRELHDRIISMRQKEVAHSDADILDIALQLNPDGDDGICVYARCPLSNQQLWSLQLMIKKLVAAIDRRCGELRLLLPVNVWL